MPDTTRLSPDFQITIPKEFADAENWRPGQEFALIPRHGSLMVVPVPTIDELFGIAEGSDPTGYRDRDDRY